MSEPMTRHGLLIMLCILFAVVPLWARKTETGFLNRTVKSGGVVYRYQMYVRAHWERGKHSAVLWFLHGTGERGEGHGGEVSRKLGGICADLWRHLWAGRFPGAACEFGG